MLIAPADCIGHHNLIRLQAGTEEIGEYSKTDRGSAARSDNSFLKRFEIANVLASALLPTGRWSVLLDKQTAGGPFSLTIVGQNTIIFNNLLVGDVWVCSGQSNMWWPVASRPRAKELIGTENPSIRLFTVPASKASQPQNDLESHWQECGPNTLVGFSAVAYNFGRQIQQTQDVPIGLIHASYGGSGIEAWISAAALADDPELSAVRERNAQAAERRQQLRARQQDEIDRYEAARAKAEKDGVKPSAPPRGISATPSSHSQLYNGMIAPLLSYGIRGVLWYQGEANVNRAADYRGGLLPCPRGPPYHIAEKPVTRRRDLRHHRRCRPKTGGCAAQGRGHVNELPDALVVLDRRFRSPCKRPICRGVLRQLPGPVVADQRRSGKVSSLARWECRHPLLHANTRSGGATEKNLVNLVKPFASMKV